MCNGMPGREGKRGLTRRTGSFKTVALLMLIPVGGIVIIFLWSFLRNAPGDGAVLTSMSDAQIATATRTNVDAIRFARGVNNHMGSRATADRRVMTDVLGALPKGMYFIDSKTTGNSIAGALARTM